MTRTQQLSLSTRSVIAKYSSTRRSAGVAAAESALLSAPSKHLHSSAKANAAIQDWSIKTEVQGLDALRKAGMEVYSNTAAEKAQFADLIRPLYNEIVDPKVVDIFVQAADKTR